MTNTELCSQAFADIISANADKKFTIEGRSFRFLSEIEKEVPEVIMCGIRANVLDFSHLENFRGIRTFRGEYHLFHKETGEKVVVRIKN